MIIILYVSNGIESLIQLLNKYVRMQLCCLRLCCLYYSKTHSEGGTQCQTIFQQSSSLSFSLPLFLSRHVLVKVIHL